MCSKQFFRTFIHSFYIESSSVQRAIAGQKRILVVITDPVIISLAYGVKSSVKIICCSFSRLNTDIARKQRVHCTYPVFFIHGDLCVKMNDLSKGMNTGVCPPACINHHRMMVNALHGLHHDRFNTYGIFLTLPSGIMTAVIAENHFYTHPIAPIAIIMTSRRSPPNNRAKSQLCIFNFL